MVTCNIYQLCKAINISTITVGQIYLTFCIVKRRHLFYVFTILNVVFTTNIL